MVLLLGGPEASIGFSLLVGSFGMYSKRVARRGVFLEQQWFAERGIAAFV
jgi:hypothetical protein